MDSLIQKIADVIRERDGRGAAAREAEKDTAKRIIELVRQHDDEALLRQGSRDTSELDDLTGI